MDAYFKKYHDVVIRTGRKEKDYIKDLVKTVDDFLEADTFDIEELTEKRQGERQVVKDIEPSGVDTMLVQLNMQRQ